MAWNLAFTWRGLYALGLPTATLRAMPTEFIDGMAARGHILGDRIEAEPNEKEPAVPEHWDAIWRNSAGERQVHVLLSLNGAGSEPASVLDDAFAEVEALCAQLHQGISVLAGHGQDNTKYQDASAVVRTGPDGQVSFRSEHFGFADGFGDPVFNGQFPPESIAQEAIGQGKLLPDNGGWAPLATGEFLIGYPDEAQEVPGEMYPFEFTRNGTFMTYRKLHENTDSFRRYLDETAQTYAKVQGLADLAEARETIMAKMAGRWANGVPLNVAPTWAAKKAFDQREQDARARKDEQAIAKIERAYVDFTYGDDPVGSKCPMTAHMRRTNPRDSLDPNGPVKVGDPKGPNGSVLNNRRRILRRGLPYGNSEGAQAADGAEHGIIFMAVCASLFRQFEFVQQQWIQYGIDFHAGNDTCPLLGNHDANAKFVIAAEPGSGKAPFICAKIPQLVEVRGGDYFFVPSMTGLRMLGMGIIDPT